MFNINCGDQLEVTLVMVCEGYWTMEQGT